MQAEEEDKVDLSQEVDLDKGDEEGEDSKDDSDPEDQPEAIGEGDDEEGEEEDDGVQEVFQSSGGPTSWSANDDEEEDDEERDEDDVVDVGDDDEEDDDDGEGEEDGSWDEDEDDDDDDDVDGDGGEDQAGDEKEAMGILTELVRARKRGATGIFEEFVHARKRGGKIYVLFRSYGMIGDEEGEGEEDEDEEREETEAMLMTNHSDITLEKEFAHFRVGGGKYYGRDGEVLSLYARMIWEMQRDEEKGVMECLEKFDHARRRGPKLYVGTDVVLAVTCVFQQIHLYPTQVAYINAHATPIFLGHADECGVVEEWVKGEEEKLVGQQGMFPKDGHTSGVR